MPTYNVKVNFELINKELAQIATYRGASYSDNTLSVFLSDDVTKDDIAAVDIIVASHDPDELTDQQAVTQQSEAARDELQELIAERLAWHAANPADAANAADVLARMQYEWVLFLTWLQGNSW